MGGEVLRKKKSERESMWEVGKRGDGGGEDGGKGGGVLRLSSSAGGKTRY